MRNPDVNRNQSKSLKSTISAFLKNANGEIHPTLAGAEVGPIFRKSIPLLWANEKLTFTTKMGTNKGVPERFVQFQNGTQRLLTSARKEVPMYAILGVFEHAGNLIVRWWCRERRNF